jgi:L-lysine exporter family protein LysE/ArgO
VGAALASFVFFFSLGYGASLLAPQMRRPGAWRILDGIIAAIMFLLALRMAHEGGWVAA